MLHNKNIIGFLFLTCLLQLSACLEATEWNLKPGENEKLVVESILTNEEIIQVVKLSTSYDDLNGSGQPVSDATVSISSFAETINFSPIGASGIYQSDFPFACQKDVPYTLNIQWQNEDYTAISALSFISPLKEITFQNIGQTDSLEILEVAPLYHPLEQAFYEINLDWSHIIAGDSSRAKMFFYTFRTVDAPELIRPPREQVIFPRGTILIEKKFGLSDGFAEFLRALVLETEWKGGAFDEASSSLPTNISNGGLGYFSVCSVLSDTIIAQ